MSNKEIITIVEKSEKDKVLDKIFWFKVILALSSGIVYGILNLTGFVNFLLFIVGITILSLIYFRRLTNEEESDYQSEVFIEGLNVSVPLFILTWTIMNTINKLE